MSLRRVLVAQAATLTAACGRFGFEPAGGVTTGVDGDPTGADAAGGDATGGDAMSVCSLPAGRRVHLTFNETAGLQAGDASGTGNLGQLLGMDPSDWVPGRLGNALDFDGVDDRVSCGSGATVDDVTTMTMCAWVRPRSYPSQYPAIADKSNDTFIGGWNFYVQNNNRFGLLANNRKWAIGGTITLNTWHHLCASWDGSAGTAGISLYQDGVVVATSQTGSNGNQTDSDAAHDLLIGRVNNATFPFDGQIDDFQIYGRVLTAPEIAQVHDCTGS